MPRKLTNGVKRQPLAKMLTTIVVPDVTDNLDGTRSSAQFRDTLYRAEVSQEGENEA
jgi:hypothetical protein